MKRVLIALIMTLPLAVGATAAQASMGPWPGSIGGTATGTPQAMVAGTVVAVTGTDSFTANAFVLTPPSLGMGIGGTSSGTGSSIFSFSFGGLPFFSTRHTSSTGMPTPTEVTITTDSSTTIHVGGVTGTATVGDLAPGAQFFALFPGSSSDSIDTLVGSAPTALFAQLPMQFYTFVGMVTATPGTDSLSVDVTRSLPSSLITAGTTTTFTTSAHTLVIGGSSLTSSSSSSGLGGLFGGLFGGSLDSVSAGDIVAGGLIGPAGLTAAQVEASPLMFLLDLPAPASTTSSSTTTSAEKQALKEADKILHGGKVKLSKQHHKTSHHRGKKSRHAGRR